MKKYKDIQGNVIKEGDLIIHGLLGQIWIVRKNTAKVINEDFEDDLAGIGLGLKGNYTEIIGSIYDK